MLNSPLGAALLGNDGSFGKTIQILGAIVKISANVQRALDMWLEGYEKIVVPYCTEKNSNKTILIDDELIKSKLLQNRNLTANC